MIETRQCPRGRRLLAQATLWLALLAAPGPLVAQDHGGGGGATYEGVPTTAPVSAAEAQRWREDLEHLATNLVERHGNAFHAVSRAQFEEEVASLERRIPELARHEIIVEAMRLVALIGDGHTVVPVLFDAAAGLHSLPLRIGWYADGLWVEAGDRQAGELVGGRLVAVGDVGVDEVLRRLAPLVARDNDMWLQVMIPHLVTRTEVLHALRLSPDPMRATITVDRGGKQVTRTVASMEPPVVLSHTDWGRLSEISDGWLDAQEAGPSALWLQNSGTPYWLQHLPEHRALYVQYNQVNNAPKSPGVAEFFRHVAGIIESAAVDRLILDLRNNSGGEGFLNTPVVRELIRSRVNRPGGLFVIIGPRTFSAAQLLVHELDRWTDAIFIGQPTGSGPQFWGDHVPFRLPNSGLLAAAAPTWWQPGGPYDERPFLPPLLAAEATFEDYRTNRDPAIELILGWDARELLVDRLMVALDEGGEKAAVHVLEEWEADPVNRYRSGTTHLNSEAYRIARERGWAVALPLFRLNVAAHPEYANGWDSLGEALFAADRRQDGLEAYRRAYELDPHVGNSAEILRQHQSDG